MAGPATDSAVAMELLPSATQLGPIEGYMKSCVGGASAPKPEAGAGAAAGAVPPRPAPERRRAAQVAPVAAPVPQPVGLRQVLVPARKPAARRPAA